MGLLFSKTYKWLFSIKEYKICILGLDNAGKTTLLYRLVLGSTPKTNPTIGSNVEEYTFKNIKCIMWDLGGQENLRKAWHMYYSNSSAIVLTVDSSDITRLYIIKQELMNILQHESLKKAKILVFANKQDLPNAMTATDISNALCLSKIKDHSWHIQACCALTGEGLEQGMTWLVEHVS